MDNLLLLCTRHHHLVHEDGWSIEREAGGEWAFVKPDGKRLAAKAEFTATVTPVIEEIKVAGVSTLMAQAKDVGQVVALEGELSQREADLESLESQQAALANSVERSTLILSLSTPGTSP